MEQSNTAEEELKKTGEWLNTQGYYIDLNDHFWMEDCRFSEHKVRDIAELLNSYSSLKLKEAIEEIEKSDESLFTNGEPTHFGKGVKTGKQIAIEILKNKIKELESIKEG